MAIRLIEEYPNRVGAPTADYPHGVPRNKSTPTATDGTPFEQSWFRDQEGFFQGLMETAGITPSGTPDTVLNSDYLDALNRVTNGVIEVNMAGAADVALSAYQGRVAALKLTGALAADVDLIVPNTERMYWIIDETTGDFSVTVKTAAGTGVKLFGAAGVVRSDGTNVVAYVNGADRRVIYAGSVAELTSIPNPLEGQQALVDGSPYKFTGGNWVRADIGLRLDDGLYRADDSGELFQLPTGVNEFDIVFEGGLYHLFYDDKTQTKHRQAATIGGLSAAADDLTIAGRYPSVLFENGTWNLFLWDQGNARTDRYTAAAAAGPYTFQGTVASGKADFAIVVNPSDGSYIGAYKETSGSPDDGYMGVLTASSLSGPWTDLGFVYSTGQRAAWHEAEEADPVPVFFNGRLFILFAGYPAAGLLRQSVAIVEIDTGGNPLSTPRILVNPREEWQDGPQGFKVFSPRLLIAEGKTRLFYSHNPGTAVSAGWAFLEYSPENGPTDARIIYQSKPLQFAPVSGVLNYKNGRPNSRSDYTVFDGADQQVYALSPLGRWSEFTVVVKVADVPASTGVQTVFAVATHPDDGTGVRVEIDASGNLAASVDNGVDPAVTFSTTFTMDDGTDHTVLLRRDSDGVVSLVADTGVQGTGSLPSPVDGMQVVKVGNNRGLSGTYAQQFIGAVSVEVYDRWMSINAALAAK